MSHVRFEDVNGHADLSGSERAHAGLLCSEYLLMGLGFAGLIGDTERECVRKIVSADDYLNEKGRFDHHDLVCHFNPIHGQPILFREEWVDIFPLALNTMWAAGSDPVRLLARIHGQSEIHCYIRGPHRQWVDGIIRQGRRAGIYRDDQGWEDVSRFLISSDAETAVLSYSVCQYFPEGDEEEESERSREDQWRIGLDRLTSEHPLLEITPDLWEDYFFEADRLTAFNISDALVPQIVKQSNEALTATE